MARVGLLNRDITEFMEKNNVITLPLIKLNKRGVYALSMLYDFWLSYAYQNNLIRDGNVYPNMEMDNLLGAEYINYGADSEGYRMSTFLNLLSSQIDLDVDMELSDALIDQANALRMLRSGYPIQ